MVRRVMAAIVAGVAVATAGVVAPARTAAAAPEERFVVVLERTRSGPSRYHFEVSTQGGPNGGFLGSLDARMRRGRIVRVWPGLTGSHGRHDEPYAYAGEASVSSCDAGGAGCGLWLVSSSQGIDFIDKTGDDPMNRTFVAVWGTGIDLKFEASGWRMRRVNWRFRFVDGQESEGAGAGIGSGVGAEVFLEARAAGGRFGSLAQASPPCSGTEVNPPFRGVGEVTLEGGVETETVTCPTGYAAASWSPRRTTWHMHGLVAGDITLAETRLFVLDLPRGYLRA